MTIFARRLGGLAVAALALAVPVAAHADFHIRSPNEIDEHELEIEHNGAWSWDRNRDNDNAQSYTAEIGYGVNSWWHPELELGFERPPGVGQSTDVSEAVWENTFSLTEPGENWADVGFYWEYAHGLQNQSSESMLFGPLFEKDVGHTTQTLNLFLGKNVGPHQDNHGFDLSYAWQSRWNMTQAFSPAVEVYGDAGQIDRIGKFQDQQFLVGPVGVGSFFVGPLGKFKYEAGYLFGATRASANGTVRWKFELEIPL